MIHEGATAERLAWLRVAVFTLWLWELVRDPFEQLTRLPRDWFEARGPWLLLPSSTLDSLWNAPAIGSLRVAAAGCAALALLGVAAPRAWVVATLLCTLTTTAFVRGFGHVDHAQVQLWCVTLILSATPAWDALALSRPGHGRTGNDYRLAWSLIALVFAFPYFETAVHRLAREGLPLFFSDAMTVFLARDTRALDDFAFQQGLWLADRPEWAAPLNLAFLVVTLAELVAPWAHLDRRVATPWLLTMLSFHLLSPILMHVAFPDNAALLVLLYAWPLTWSRARHVDATTATPSERNEATA